MSDSEGVRSDPETLRDGIAAEHRAMLLARPEWTLVRIGWKVSPGRVQGSVFYRVGDGLGPTSRDRSPRDVLEREVMGSHMSHADQRWGIEILASPKARELVVPSPQPETEQ